MSVHKLFGNKTAYKHIGHPARFHGPRTSPRAAPRSQLHHQCAAKLPHYRRFRSGGARQPYSARCLRTRRGGKALHGAYSALAPQISQQRCHDFWTDRES